MSIKINYSNKISNKSLSNIVLFCNEKYNINGLKQGDRWCLCADRWIEPLNHDIAPNIILASTHIKMLEKIDFNILKKFGIEYMNLN